MDFFKWRRKEHSILLKKNYRSKNLTGKGKHSKGRKTTTYKASRTVKRQK